MEHLHFCDDCEDRWGHEDHECADLEAAYFQFGAWQSFDYTCPQHAGSFETTGILLHGEPSPYWHGLWLVVLWSPQP
jgi:hypothetical protein